MTFDAISYNLPANPSRYRVATWKCLRELGAAYLQDGVAMVPAQAGLRDRLEELRRNIVAWNGRASLLTLEFVREDDEREALATFASAREEEYAAIRQDAARLLEEIKAAGGWEPAGEAAQRYSLELRRLRRRMETAQEHDFFGADGSEAQRLLHELAALLPADDRPRRERKRKGTPAERTAPSAAPVPTALETARQLLEPEPEEEEDDMPVFLF